MNEGQLDGAGLRARYDELEADVAQRAEAQAALPQSAEEYEIALPEMDFGDLPLPEGYAPQLDTSEEMQPIWGEFQAWLHELGAPKEAMGQALGLLAKYEAMQYSRGFTAAQADFESLGQQAQARVSNIERKLDSKLSKEEADALKAATGTSQGIKALEKLLLPATPRTPTPQPSGVDTENMTPMQRLEHANRQRAQAG